MSATPTAEANEVIIKKHPEDASAYRLTTKQLLPADRESIFEFFSDAYRLEQITPPWLNFSVITDPPINMELGALIDYRLRLRGIPIRWRTRISQWNPPYEFVDEQLRGPYRYWHHLHTFEETDEGTICRDQVDYAVPGGAVVHNLIVRKDLHKIFSFRQSAMRLEFPCLV